jgi:hypothetical protein
MFAAQAEKSTVVLIPTHKKSLPLLIIKRSFAPLVGTNYPITHFCLNALGLFNIIKGSAIQIPILRWFMDIDQQVNPQHLFTGLGLLLCSRILIAYETARDDDNQNE